MLLQDDLIQIVLLIKDFGLKIFVYKSSKPQNCFGNHQRVDSLEELKFDQEREMSSLLLDYEDKKEILAELERRKKARAIAVTIDDDQIKNQLRSLNQPICELRLSKSKILDR